MTTTKIKTSVLSDLLKIFDDDLCNMFSSICPNGWDYMFDIEYDSHVFTLFNEKLYDDGYYSQVVLYVDEDGMQCEMNSKRQSRFMCPTHFTFTTVSEAADFLERELKQFMLNYIDNIHVEFDC